MIIKGQDVNIKGFLFVAVFWPLSSVAPSYAQEALCANVRIEIRQELTLERQGFDAFMRINNGLDTFSLQNVNISVTFEDENGLPENNWGQKRMALT